MSFVVANAVESGVHYVIEQIIENIRLFGSKFHPALVNDLRRLFMSRDASAIGRKFLEHLYAAAHSKKRFRRSIGLTVTELNHPVYQPLNKIIFGLEITPSEKLCKDRFDRYARRAFDNLPKIVFQAGKAHLTRRVGFDDERRAVFEKPRFDCGREAKAVIFAQIPERNHRQFGNELPGSHFDVRLAERQDAVVFRRHIFNETMSEKRHRQTRRKRYGGLSGNVRLLRLRDLICLLNERLPVLRTKSDFHALIFSLAKWTDSHNSLHLPRCQSVGGERRR